MNAYPTASVKTGEGYKLSFSNIDLPVYPDQTSSSLYLSGTAYYKITDKSSDTKKIGKLQAKITNGVIAQTEVCTTVNYGVGGKKRGYGYPTCRWTSLSTNLWLAYGNILEVARAYGYNTTGPIIDVFPPNPQPAPANPQPEGGTQTGTTGTTGSGTGTTGAGATQTTGTGGSTPAPIIQTTPTTPVPQESAKPTGGGRAEFQMDAQ